MRVCGHFLFLRNWKLILSFLSTHATNNSWFNEVKALLCYIISRADGWDEYCLFRSSQDSPLLVDYVTLQYVSTRALLRGSGACNFLPIHVGSCASLLHHHGYINFYVYNHHIPYIKTRSLHKPLIISSRKSPTWIEVRKFLITVSKASSTKFRTDLSLWEKKTLLWSKELNKCEFTAKMTRWSTELKNRIVTFSWDRVVRTRGTSDYDCFLGTRWVRRFKGLTLTCGLAKITKARSKLSLNKRIEDLTVIKYRMKPVRIS